MAVYRSSSGPGGTTTSWSNTPGAGGAAGTGGFGGFGSMLASGGTSLLVGAASSGLGSLLGRSAKKRNKRKLADYMARVDADLTTGAESAKDTIRRDLVEGRGQIGQSLIDRGLYNTSVLDTMSTQANQNAAAEIAGIQERKGAMLAGYRADAEASQPNPQYGQQIGGILSDLITKPPNPPSDNQNDSNGGLASMLSKRGAPAAVAAGQVADSDAARTMSLGSLQAGQATAGVPGIGWMGGLAGMMEYGRKGVSGLGKRAKKMYVQD